MFYFNTISKCFAIYELPPLEIEREIRVTSCRQTLELSTCDLDLVAKIIALI